VEATGARVSGCPSWAAIHATIAAESAPAARIAALSMTSPPEPCGRDRRLTNMRIASSSIVRDYRVTGLVNRCWKDSWDSIQLSVLLARIIDHRDRRHLRGEA
jgi:hypothetical protein